ncbi:Fip1-domain-containing protein [Mollisia scopiformis]|uniref:Fip1-domain-containing protein n=1 Tax=Mollisia scopiformis TaxID=149040 RepID=A0A194X7X0_MOLSC|nr:Fip1-domain-containing protein [Mollisia scopiformis]KUJ16258.1 Fip1-domain-containing protein [Mollisia scopiformis]
MDVDEDDDFYAAEGDSAKAVEEQSEEPAQSAPQPEQQDEDLEEGEEEDEAVSEGSDSDIDIITERKDGSKLAPPVAQPRYNDIRNIPQRTASSDVATKPSPAKKEVANKSAPPASGADLPGVSTSEIDIDGKPVYEPAGKPITQVNIDLDLPDNDKPWRRPGTDVSDYFNYGFDEFTWALYSSKQDSLRSEYNQEKIAENNKKMFEEMNMMMAMGAMPGMMPGASGTGAMSGMEGMPPEMQQMMQQMMASGVDPSQMDPATMFASMQGGQASTGGATGAQTGNQAQGFGGQGGFGQGQNQYGYDQGMMNSGDARNRGGNFGRGRGKGRW